MLVGYMRVSTTDDRQTVDLQRDALVATGVDHRHLHTDKASGALDKIVARLRRDGSEVNVIGYNAASADIVDRFAMHDKTGFELGAVPH